MTTINSTVSTKTTKARKPLTAEQKAARAAKAKATREVKKAVSAAATKPEVKQPEKTVKATTVTVFHSDNRPTLGKRLNAHTVAVLEVLKIAANKPVNKRLLSAAWGDTAINFHGRNKRLSTKDGAVTFTDGGIAYLKSREFDRTLADQYKRYLSSGNVGNGKIPGKKDSFITKTSLVKVEVTV